MGPAADRTLSKYAHVTRMVRVQGAIIDFTRGKTTREEAQKQLAQAGCEPKAVVQLLDAAVKNLRGLRNG